MNILNETYLNERENLRLHLLEKAMFPKEKLVEYQIKNPKCLYIKDNNENVFWGADQSFFNPFTKKENKFQLSYSMHKYGCGLSAFANLTMYLIRKGSYNEIFLKKLLHNDYLYIDEYKQYALNLQKNYHLIYKFIGTHGFQLSKRLNQYFKRNSIDLRACWNCQKQDTLIPLIIEMLNNDIPVILGVSKNTNLFDKSKLPVYEKDEINGSLVYRQAIRRRKNEALTTSGHFFTITNLIIYDENFIVFKVSSWGKEYYVLFDDYLEYVEKQKVLKNICNNVIYIFKK